MPELRLVLALHYHQPLGQLESVLEQAYETSYRPLLDVLEKCRRIPVALHTSGPLLEWLVERHPEFIERLCALIARGQIEILGGGFFEPVMTMIPHRDRVGQIRAFTDYIQEVLATPVRGVWLAEGIWEQSLVSSLVQAGVEFTLLDDFHFERGSSQAEGPFGYYLTESLGHLLKVFPACPALPNGISFAEPAHIHDFLSRLALRRPGSTVVFAVDENAFQSRPNTSYSADMMSWFGRFCDLISADGDWLLVTTFADVADRSLPLGKVYLSDSSHRFRNNQSRRAEGDEMYARMLGISERLAAAESTAESDPDYLEVARLELYRGQCSSAYHGNGASGGLSLPHLRNAVYHHLIAAHNALDEIEGNIGPRVRLDVGDFNLDARQEVRLENDHLIALVRPARGGHVFELDLRQQLTNALATFDPAPENSLTMTADSPGKAGLSAHDRHPRKALVDHFYPVEATLENLLAYRDLDCGDFALGTYQARAQRDPRRVALIMDRAGRAGDHSIRVKKTIALAAGEAMLFVRYEIEQIPTDACLHFAVEINLAGMREQFPSGSDSTLDLPHENGLRLNDQSLDLCVSLAWSQSAGLWCFPIETSSQQEGGREQTHQSCAVIPHWHVTPDETGRWEVSIQWAFDHAVSPAGRRLRSEPTSKVGQALA